MTIETFLDLAERFDGLGTAVQEQLREILRDSDTMEDQNPNALKMIRRQLLRDMITSGDSQLAAEASDLQDQIDEYLTPRRETSL